MFRNRPARLVAALVVVFFTWTLAGGATAAHAAKLVANQSGHQATEPKDKTPGERFGQAVEGIGSVLADAALDLTAKKRELKARRGEMATLAAQMHAEFAATEKRLRDAKLPDEILERHRKFVAHFESNLAELTGELDALDAAKTAEAAGPAIEKLRQHLERAKAPSRHQPLDPNNLPHRQPKAQKREPRLTPEEFQRDVTKDKHAWRSQKRILVASTGSLSGLIGPDELAETIEVQLTPEIRAKALELGNNPVRIYEWVRNNVEFVPTWGSIQGAQMTLETKQGNAFDTASLLIALLRAAGIQARYVTGTVELPIDKVMNWAGGFTDPLAALDFMSSGGIPTKGLTAGGKIVAARIEHVWAEAFINYIPFRGAKHVNGKEDTWISLDPSYKQYTYTQGIDIKAAVPFDAQGFLTQIQSGATINETQGYVTGVNSLLVQQTMQDYQTRVQNYIQQNYPNATVGDVLGKKEIVKKEYSYLLGTLPYRTAIKGATFATLPDTLRHKLSFNVKNDTVDLSTFDPDAPAPADTSLNISKSLPELAGKKITLSYTPATAQDEAVLAAYLPKPHADGSPIQPSELPSQLPAYLITVKPELRIDGQVVATGAPVGLGGTNIFTMSFSDPAYGSSQITNYIDAGVYQAVGLNLGRISQEQIVALKAKLEVTKDKLQNQDFAGITKDDLVGDLLNTAALVYHAELGTMNYIATKTMGVNAITLPSETIFATKLNVMYLWGFPRFVQAGGLNMDADYLMQVVKAKDGNNETAKQYMLSSGMTSSALEHKVPEQLFSTPENPVEAISTVKALKIAHDRGMPIYTVNQANVAKVLPQLQLEQQVKTDLQNAVNAGKVVTVSKTNITYNGWTGCGYIITNPETGAGAYMIGGVSGAIITWVVIAFLAIALLLFCVFPVPMLALAGALAIMAAEGVVFAQLLAVVIGALAGAGIGLFLSDNAKEVLLSAVQDLMFALLTGGLVLSSLLGPIAGIIIFILWLLSYHEVFEGASLIRYRKIYC